MYLIVGLGNPEKKYAETYHNVGFLCADALADKLNVSFDKTECKAVTAHARVGGEKVIIAKPTTYMNLSGESVVMLVNKYKIDLSRLAVIYDDVDLPLGSLRIRKSGSAGTHNGMRNIVSLLGTTEFLRIRVGIGQDTVLSLMDYVLSKIDAPSREKLLLAVKSAAEAAEEFVSGDAVDLVMQRHNATTV